MMTDFEYREKLIEDILKTQTSGWFTREELEQKPIYVLLIIYNNIGVWSSQ